MPPATTHDTQAKINARWGEAITYGRAGVAGGGGTAWTVGGVAWTVGGVAWTVGGGSGGTAEYEFTAARYELGEEEVLSSYGVYGVRRERWTFSTDELAGARPKMRDTVTPDDDDITRVVTRVEGSAWLKFWRVDTAYPSLAAELDDTATVYRASPTPTDLGLRSPGLTAEYTGVACRLQPDTRAREFDDGTAKVLTRARYVCVFGEAVELNAGDVVEASSVRYEVVEQSEIESLGLLTFARCERIE